jgi:hypothetical protein
MRLVVREKGFPLGAVMAGAGALGALGVRLLHLDRLPIPLCAFRAITGVPCMGCGSTRALGRLASLDVAGALAFQPLTATLAMGVAVWGLVDVVLLTRRRALGLQCTPREGLFLLWSLLGLGLVNWAYLILMGR